MGLLVPAHVPKRKKIGIFTQLISKSTMLQFKGIIDTTMRDGQQSPLMFDARKYRFSLDDKKKILNGLIQLGVSHFEFFAPVVSASEREHFRSLRDYVRKISKRNIMLIAHCRCHEDDINTALAEGFNGLNLYIGVARHAQVHSHGMSYEKILQRIPELLKKVRRQYPDLYLRFSVEDSFRTSLKDIYAVYDLVAPYVDTLGMPDTVGIAMPEDVSRVVRALRKRYPKNFIECHFHNDRGFSLINSVTAVQEGAHFVDCSIWGMAERSGITSVTGLLLNLQYLDKNISEQFNLPLCYPVNVLMGSILNLHVPTSEPVSLTNRTHTAGVHQKAVLNNAKVYEAHNLADFGVANNQILLGPLSGWNLIHYYLKEIENYVISHDIAKKITKEFKEQTEKMDKNNPPEQILRCIVENYHLEKIPVPEQYGRLRLENLQ